MVYLRTFQRVLVCHTEIVKGIRGGVPVPEEHDIDHKVQPLHMERAFRIGSNECMEDLAMHGRWYSVLWCIDG